MALLASESDIGGSLLVRLSGGAFRVQDMFCRGVAGRDRLVGFHCVIERPRLHGRRLQRAALETGAELIKYRRDLVPGELGGVNSDQALPVMIEIDQI